MTASAPAPLHLTYDDTTLVDHWERAVHGHPGAVATDFLGATRTYAQLGVQVEAVAGALHELGVRRGDVVALLLPNCPQHVVAFQAVLRLGATVAEHNPLYTAAELRHPFTDHGARVAIVWDKAVPVVQALAEDTPVEHVVAVDLTRELPRLKRAALRLPLPAARRTRAAMTAPAPRALPWAAMLRGRPVGSEAPRPVAGDTALLLYTSGTTGAPKGVPLTHGNLVANVTMGIAWVPDLTPGHEGVLVVLPLFHAYGVTVGVLLGIAVAARLVLLPRPDAEMIVAAIKRRTPTFFPAVPPLYAAVLRTAQEKGVSLRGLRSSLSGAMSLPADLVGTWEQATGGLLVEGYGLTETSPVVVGNPFDARRKPGAIGIPFPDTEIRVVSLDDPGREVARGEAGELLVRGPQVFGGYKDRPEATAEAFVDGWFRTGDVVTQDEDGFLTVVDRIKEMIVTGGFNVYPSEVEDVLRQHPSVQDAAVVGVPDPRGGERVLAAVVAADGAQVDPEALRAHCRGSLTAYKVPREVHRVEDLPRNATGKVLRREVADRLRGQG